MVNKQEWFAAHPALKKAKEELDAAEERVREIDSDDDDFEVKHHEAFAEWQQASDIYWAELKKAMNE